MKSISVKQQNARWPRRWLMYWPPRRLRGNWLRLWELFFIFVTLSNMALLIYGIYEQSVMDAHFAEYLGKAVLAGLVVWGIVNLKRATFIYVIIYSLFSIILGTVLDQITAGEIHFVDFFLNARIIDFLAIFYFSLAKQVKEYLIQPVFLQTKSNESLRKASHFKPKSFIFWRNLLVYFALYSLLGHWIEIIYCLGVRQFTGYYDPNSHIWSSFFYPFFIYGAGMALCVVLLYPIKERIQRRLHGLIPTLLCSYLFNCLACAVLEFSIGMLMNQPNAAGVYPLWDYSKESFNLLGQICLKDTLAFAAVATVTVWVIYPGMERAIARFKPDTFNMIALVIIIITLLLTTMYFVNMPISDTLGSLANQASKL